MKQNTRVLFCLAGLALITGLGVWQLLTGPTLVRQLRNMKLASEHIPKVQAALEFDPEFRHFEIAGHTAADGSIYVEGALTGTNRFQLLRKSVMETRPPVDVLYLIVVREGTNVTGTIQTHDKHFGK